MKKIIEVESPIFEYNIENPEKVRYTDVRDDNREWRLIMVNTYATGFPELHPGQILYKLKGEENRGYILNT